MNKDWWMEEVLRSLRAIEKQGEAILGLSSQVEELKKRMGELEAKLATSIQVVHSGPAPFTTAFPPEIEESR